MGWIWIASDRVKKGAFLGHIKANNLLTSYQPLKLEPYMLDTVIVCGIHIWYNLHDMSEADSHLHEALTVSLNFLVFFALWQRHRTPYGLAIYARLSVRPHESIHIVSHCCRKMGYKCYCCITMGHTIRSQQKRPKGIVRWHCCLTIVWGWSAKMTRDKTMIWHITTRMA